MAFSDSNLFTIAVPVEANTAFAALAASLSPGEFANGPGVVGLGDSAGADPDDVRQTIQWGNRFFYDHTHSVAHLVGKDANTGGGNGAQTNSYYDMVAEQWVPGTRFNTEVTGHIFESYAFDPAERRCYYGQWSTQASSVRHWTWGDGLQTWNQTAVGYAWSSSNAVNPVLCWHPNLYGPGDGGLLAFRMSGGANVQIHAWRRSTNTWTASGSPVIASTATGGSPGLGAMVYVRAWDAVIATFATGSTYYIGAGDGTTFATPITISNPPIACRHPAGSPMGMLFDDPLGIAGPYILEKATNNEVHRLIRNNPTTFTWSTRSYLHPFPHGFTESSQWNYYIASCYPLGVFWCIAQTGTPTDIVWRPED